MRHGKPFDHIGALQGFGARGFHEFQPRWRVLEQTADLNPRAILARGGFRRLHMTLVNGDRPAILGIGLAAGDG